MYPVSRVSSGNIHSTSLDQNLRARSDGCAGNGAGHCSVATTNRRTENRSQQGAAADVARGFAVRAETAVANSMPPPDIASRVASTPYRRSLIVIESRSTTSSSSGPRRTTSSAEAPRGIARRPPASNTSFSTMPLNTRPSIACVSMASVVLTCRDVPASIGSMAIHCAVAACGITTLLPRPR
jgi:hypothetical protein